MIKSKPNKPLHILVVSNDTETIRFHKSLFSDFGHQLSCVVNAYDAIDIFIRYLENGRPFDLVFTDYQIPGMNGISLARRLKAIHDGVIQMLLPTPFFKERQVQKEYNDFGGFFQVPDTSFSSYQKILEAAQVKQDCHKETTLSEALA